nr:unnamed protein product [Spirometra erinaceieuropaei]
MSCQPQDFNNFLLPMKLPPCGNKSDAIVRAYGPKLISYEDVKYYKELRVLLTTVSRADQLVFLVDLSRLDRPGHPVWKGGLGNCKNNGLDLFRTSTEHHLLMTTTFPRLPMQEAVKWMYPRSLHWHMLDYVRFPGA